jgi:hypothetical protein
MSTDNKAKRVISLLLGESEDQAADFARQLMSIVSNEPTHYTPSKLSALHSLTAPPELKADFERMLSDVEEWVGHTHRDDSKAEGAGRAIGSRMGLGQKLRRLAPGSVDARRLSSDVFDENEYPEEYIEGIEERIGPEGEKAIATSGNEEAIKAYAKKFPEAKLEWAMNGWLDWLDL